MRLDAVLASPDSEWLTTRSDKLAYMQARSVQDLAKQFPGTFPIGVDPSGRVVLIYLAAVPWTDDFRTFLVGHTALLSAASVWTLHLVFPQPLRRAMAAYQTVAHEELENPLQAQTIRELQHYFFHRRRGTDLNTIPEALRAILNRYAGAFGGSRFTHLYRRWLADEDTALTPISPVIPEALASGRAQIECLVLPHTYDHLSPLVSRGRARRQGRQQEEERGDETRRSINPSLNPVP